MKMGFARRIVVAACCAVVSVSAWADVTGDLCAIRRGMGAEVKEGYWHADLEKCKTYCQANGVPLVAVWSNGDQCGHCFKLESNLLSDAFTKWRKQSGIVFYFGWNADAAPNGVYGPACVWCCNGNIGRTLPFVRIWWPKKSVDVLTDGDTWDANKGRWGGRNDIYRPEEFVEPGDYGTFNPGGRACIHYLTNGVNGVLRKYKPGPKVTYFGGEFVAPADERSGLQAVAGQTRSVSVPLSRTNETALAQNVGTNNYVIAYPDGSQKSGTYLWSKGATNATIAVDVSMLDAGDVNKKITLKLLDSTNGVVHTSFITCVSDQDYPNSSKNPYWTGERTAETLAWGEWSMDLGAVTNKVAASNRTWRGEGKDKRARIMYLVSGSCWCPDCAMGDKYLFDRSEFKEWAASNRVALGVIDIPASPTSAPAGRPSLLTYVWERASDAFVTCRSTCPADETMRIQSGAAYLSRHAIAPDKAAEVAKRNAALLKKSVAEGGLNDPDRVARGQERTGVPVVLFLRDDGKVVVRWSLMSDRGPESWNANYLKRFDEMIAAVDAENDRLAAGQKQCLEEANGYVQTTTETVSKRGTKKGATLSNFDLADAYRIEEAAVGQVVNFKVSGPDSVQATVEIVQVSGSSSTALASAGGSWANELSVTAKIPANSYLVVRGATVEGKSGTAAPGYLEALSAKSTVAAYEIVSSNVLVPTSAEQVEYSPEPLVTLQTEAGLSYKITNLKPNGEGFVTNDRGENVFQAGATEGVYVALATDSVRVALQEKEVGGAHAGEYRSSYQIWETGRIGFERSEDVVREVAETNSYPIQVARTGGVSGTARCAIYLDEEKSDAIWDGTVFEWNKDGTILEWGPEDGETKTVTVNVVPNEFWDGDQRLVFVLKSVDAKGEALASDAGIGTSELVLTIRDNDTKTPGKLAISDTLPLPAKDMTVVAGKGEKVSLWVGRFYGADGEVSCELTTTGGRLSATRLDWASRTSDEREVELDLAGCRDGQVVRVTLVPLDGAKVEAERMSLTVKIVDENPPAFKEIAALNLESAAYLPIAETALTVDPGSVGSLAAADVSLYSGRLAPGLRAEYDPETGKLVISGVPTKAGEYAAVYRVSEGAREGMTATVAFKVYDVTEGTRLNPALNPSVGVTRSFIDLIVRNESTKELAGLLTLTVPRTGRLSAQFRAVDGSVLRLASENWSELGGANELVAGLHALAGDGSLKVTAFADGKLGLELDDGSGATYFIEIPEYGWSAEKTAAAWAGYYTVSLPQQGSAGFLAGPGFMTMKLDADDAKALETGSMTYAGMLPNGKAVSGTATLAALDWDKVLKRCNAAALPIVSASSTDSLYGILSIKPDAAAQLKTLRRSVSCREETLLAWNHAETVPDLAFTAKLDAFGGIFDAEENIALCCEQVFEGKQPYFFLLQEKIDFTGGFALGLPVSWESNPGLYPRADRAVRIWRGSDKNKIRPVDVAAAEETYGLSLTFDRLTGIVSGSVRIDFIPQSPSQLACSQVATFRGVVMPGWGASCKACQLGNEEALLRPFISGSAFFADTYLYKDAKGRDRTKQTKRGCEFTVGLNPGE